jgi:hypothetical protein
MSQRPPEQSKSESSRSSEVFKIAIQSLADGLQKFAPALLILAGIGLTVFALATFSGTTTDDFAKLADILVKFIAIVVVGLLLPRLVTLKFGGAEVTLRQDTKASLGEASLAFQRELSDMRGQMAALEQRMGPPSILESAAQKTAPTFPEPTLPKSAYPNDTQRGRFGGLASRAGFTLSARFPMKDSNSEIVRVILQVKRDDGLPMDQPVQFYLDETFPRNVISVAPTPQGEVKVDFLVWGGFTVGAWLQHTKDVLLELNLATVRDAPPVIRYR